MTRARRATGKAPRRLSRRKLREALDRLRAVDKELEARGVDLGGTLIRRVVDRLCGPRE